MVIKNFAKRNSKYFYFLFRILVGFMFFSRGMQKLFGAFGGHQVNLMSQFGAAGVIELVGGIFILIGLFTQWTTLITGIEMLFAFFMAHAPKGIIPIANGGEASLMFFAAFLVLFAYGAGIWAVDNLFKKNKK